MTDFSRFANDPRVQRDLDAIQADRKNVSKVKGSSRAVVGKKIGARHVYLLSSLARRVEEAGRER
jgi:hypothetical protein